MFHLIIYFYHASWTGKYPPVKTWCSNSSSAKAVAVSLLRACMFCINTLSLMRPCIFSNASSLYPSIGPWNFMSSTCINNIDFIKIKKISVQRYIFTDHCNSVVVHIKKKNKRLLGLNRHLSIRDSTTTSCQKGSYLNVNRPIIE